MKKLLTALLMVPVMALAENAVTTGDRLVGNTLNAPIPAGSTVIVRQAGGSGTPGFTGVEPATYMGDGIYHAPQFLPNSPTAASIYPRVIDIECTKTAAGSFLCDGYNWSPSMGSAEYLYIRPFLKASVAPVVVEKLVPTPFPVYVEPKKKKE